MNTNLCTEKSKFHFIYIFIYLDFSDTGYFFKEGLKLEKWKSAELFVRALKLICYQSACQPTIFATILIMESYKI